MTGMLKKTKRLVKNSSIQMRTWIRLQVKFKVNGVKDKVEKKLNKVKMVMIEMLKKIKKLVKNSSIQMRTWIRQQVKFKDNGEQDKQENLRKNIKVKDHMTEMLRKTKK